MIAWIITLWTCADSLSWCKDYVEFLFGQNVYFTGLEVLNHGPGFRTEIILFKYKLLNDWTAPHQL